MARAAIDTVTLMGVKRELPRFEPVFLSLFFPQVVTFATKEIGFDRIKKNVKLAPFVSPMSSGKANRKKGGHLVSFEPAYVKPTDTVEPGRLIKRSPGEALGGELTPKQRHDAIVVDMLGEQEESIVSREEWMAVSAVMTGQVVVEGEGYDSQVVDYDRSPENNVALAGAAKWSAQDAATYDPTDDIEEWAARAKGTVGLLIFDKAGWALFKKFKAVKDKLDMTQNNGGSSLELGPQTVRVMQRKGMFGEFECWVYSGRYTNDDGVDQYFMPNASMLLAPAAGDDVMAYGGIQDAEANMSGVVEAVRYPSNWFSKNPSIEWLQTQSAPLPVMFNADDYVSVML